MKTKETNTRERHSRSLPTHSRREVLGYLGGILAGTLATGCTPLRIAFSAYPEEYDREPHRVDRTLRAFAMTVVPGIPLDTPNLCRVFHDSYYPFHKYRNFFASDLCDRGTRLVGRSPFEWLSAADRARVIQDGLDAGGTISRLYAGAVYLIQIALLSGIYDDRNGCPLIGFEGQYQIRSAAELTYPIPDRFLASSRTRDGNPI